MDAGALAGAGAARSADDAEYKESVVSEEAPIQRVEADATDDELSAVVADSNAAEEAAEGKKGGLLKYIMYRLGGIALVGLGLGAGFFVFFV